MKKNGFTLLELLTVFIIIGILGAMLLVALTKMRTHSQAMACSNNLRQIGVAVQLYLDENDYRFPGCESDDPNECWYTRLMPYVDNPDVYECPAYKYHHDDIYDASSRNYFSYGYNKEGLNEPAEGYKIGVDINYVISPTKCILVADGSEGAGAETSRYFIDKNNLPTSRHNGGTNILFVDSHVTWQSVNSIPTSGQESLEWWNY